MLFRSQTQRLLSLERAVEGFASGQNLQEPVTRQLDVAKAGAHDEVGRLAEGIRQMMQEVVHARESLLAANRSLTSERERIRRIIETSPVGICIYDEPGHCLTTNEAMARHVGATTAQVLALNYHEIEAWTGNGALEAAQRVLDGGHQESLITHATGPFGKEFWLNLTFCALHDNGAKRLMLMTTDISEFRQIGRAHV